MDLRRIIAFLSRTILRKSTVKQASLLLDLPLCLIYTIFDELQWPEKVMLSQTCKDLRYNLRQKCSSILRKATVLERLEYLTILGNILPDHYLCTACCVLHLVDPKDIPITDCNIIGANLYRAPCPLPEPLWSRHRLHHNYAVAFRHVQLAIKYSRMGGGYQRYRASIMQRFVVSNRGISSIGYDFVAEPVIVRGRFILMTRFEFYGDVEEVSYWTFMKTTINFCPHHMTGKFNDHNDTFNILMRSLFRQSRNTSGPCQEAYSCSRCPSDYAIAIKDKRAIVSVWHDLGTGASTDDPYWQSHIWDYENNMYNKGTEFPYEHGSIEKMYYSSGT